MPWSCRCDVDQVAEPVIVPLPCYRCAVIGPTLPLRGDVLFVLEYPS